MGIHFITGWFWRTIIYTVKAGIIMAGERLIIFPLVISFLAAIPTFLTSTSETLVFSFLGFNFDITFSDFFLLLTGIVAVISIVAGINFLGSGLNDSATHILFKITTFGLLWVFLIGISGIGGIPYVGIIIYWALSLLFFIGVILNIRGSGG